MSTIVIRYDGDDITDDILIEGAHFVGMTDGNVGEATFRVKDRRGGVGFAPNYFQVGKHVTLDIDGVRVWGGWTDQVTRSYPFPVVDTTVPDNVKRYWEIKCVDYNVLFTRRKLWNIANPTKQMRVYRPSVNNDSDKDIITDFVDEYLDLSGDGFQSGGAHQISLADVAELGQIYWVEACTAVFQPASPGMDWGDGMRHITEWSGGVFYIGYRNSAGTHNGPTLYYHDVNTKTGPYQLNDRPASQGGSHGVRNFLHRTDASQLATEAFVWGAGVGSTEMVFWRETASANLAQYGRFQWGDFSQQMYMLECIKHRAKTYIHGSRTNKRGHKAPVETWTCTIFRPDFAPGDVVSVRSYIFGIQDTVPIRKMTITFPTNEDAQFDLVMTHELDTAYTTSQWMNQRDGGDPRKRRKPGPQWDGWWYNSIPVGIGPIITIPPMEPNPPAQTLVWEGPVFAAGAVINIMEGSTVSTNGIFRQINTGGGQEAYRGVETFNHGWPSCSCGVCLGCFGPGVTSQQVWHGFYGGLTPPAEGAALYVLAEQVCRVGVGGSITISFTTDQDGQWSAPQNWPSPESPPGIVVGTLDITGMPYEPPDAPAGCWWSGYNHAYMGGLRWRHTFGIQGSAITAPEGWFNWVVYTPTWTKPVPPIMVCDQSCGDPYPPAPAGHGPMFGGQAGSGKVPLNFPTDTIWQKIVVPWETDTGERAYPSPEDYSTYTLPYWLTYYTQYPYAPGSLEVSINGIGLRQGTDFKETSPTTGKFEVYTHAIFNQVGEIKVKYLVADPNPSPIPDWVDYYRDSPSGTLGDQNGRFYRPRFRSQLGWGTEYDGLNCSAAAACMLLDRATMGRLQETPPEIRAASGDTSGGLSLDQIVNTLGPTYKEAMVNPGPISWEAFLDNVAEGRGAQLTGHSSAFLSYNLHARSEYTGEPFIGFHSIYVNEVRADEYCYVYDPAFRVGSKYGITPGWYPPAAIRDYAAYRTGSPNRVWAIYTVRTPRI